MQRIWRIELYRQKMRNVGNVLIRHRLRMQYLEWYTKNIIIAEILSQNSGLKIQIFEEYGSESANWQLTQIYDNKG